MTYSIRVKESISLGYHMTAKVSDELAKNIVFECAGGGEWTKFNGKRAFRVLSDCAYGDGNIEIFLWKGTLLIEEK